MPFAYRQIIHDCVAIEQSSNYVPTSVVTVWTTVNESKTLHSTGQCGFSSGIDFTSRTSASAALVVRKFSVWVVNCKFVVAFLKKNRPTVSSGFGADLRLDFRLCAFNGSRFRILEATVKFMFRIRPQRCMAVLIDTVYAAVCCAKHFMTH